MKNVFPGKSYIKVSDALNEVAGPAPKNEIEALQELNEKKDALIVELEREILAAYRKINNTW